MQLVGHAAAEQEQTIAYLTLTYTAKHTKYKFHKSDASKALQMTGGHSRTGLGRLPAGKGPLAL